MSDDTLIALVAGAIGLAILALVASSLREAAAMKRWPIAKGRVLSSKVEEYRDSAGARGGRVTLYHPVVVYEYEVGGQRFRGERIAQSPGMNQGVADAAAAVTARYASGNAVDVRYNPKRPAECVLEPRVPKSWIFGLAIAIGLLALATRMYLK